MPPEECRRRLDATRVEVECCAHSTDKPHVESIPVQIDPLLLLRSCQSNPQDVRPGCIHDFDHLPALLPRVVQFKGRRVRTRDGNIGEVDAHSLSNASQGLRGSAQEEYPHMRKAIEALMQGRKHVWATHPLPNSASQHSRCKYDADAVRDQPIRSPQRFRELLVLQRYDVRMRIETSQPSARARALNAIDDTFDDLGQRARIDVISEQ